jgi:hypothetical protein
MVLSNPGCVYSKRGQLTNDETQRESWASALPLEPHPSPFAFSVFFQIVSQTNFSQAVILLPLLPKKLGL